MTETDGGAPAAPAGVDIDKPSAARMYDWYLGGSHNWAVDREFGKQVEQLMPQVKPVARQNRAFMNRAAIAALEAGTRQFVDLGSGVPTVGNVHEVVRDHLPAGERSRVLYVDYEPVAVAHATVNWNRTTRPTGPGSRTTTCVIPMPSSKIPSPRSSSISRSRCAC